MKPFRSKDAGKPHGGIPEGPAAHQPPEVPSLANVRRLAKLNAAPSHSTVKLVNELMVSS